MNEEMLEKDLIELTGEDGGTYTFEVYDYFFYNGEEYAILQDPDEDEAEEESDDEDEDEAEEKAEEEEAPVPEPEKKKKRGFFSRLFGRKGDDDE